MRIHLKLNVWKVILYTILGFIGIIAITVAVMWACGLLNNVETAPESIYFVVEDEALIDENNSSSLTLLPSDSFVMSVETDTEDVTTKNIKLSFQIGSTVDEEGFVTDGVFKIPSSVKLGQKFTVEIIDIDAITQNHEATLVATSSAVTPLIYCNLVLDLNVSSLSIAISNQEDTEQNIVSLGSNFEVEANFDPVASEDVLGEQKEVFFDIGGNNITYVGYNSENNSYIFFSNSVSASNQSINITAYTFTNIKTKKAIMSRIYELYPEFDDVDVQTAQDIVVSYLKTSSFQSGVDYIVSEGLNVLVKPADVSNFSLSFKDANGDNYTTQSVLNLLTNKKYVLSTSKISSGVDFTLGANVIVKNNNNENEQADSMLSNIGIAFFEKVESDLVSTEDVVVVGSNTIEYDGITYFLPKKTNSYGFENYEFYTISDKTYYLQVVLFTSNLGDSIFEISDNIFEISFADSVEDDISFINENEVMDALGVVMEHDEQGDYIEKLSTIDLLDYIYIPETNQYNTRDNVKFFVATSISLEQGEALADYLNCTKTFVIINGLYYYELSSSVITFKKYLEQFSVLFATIKTDAGGSGFLLTEDGVYDFAKVSSALNIYEIDTYSIANIKSAVVSVTEDSVATDDNHYYIPTSSLDVVVKLTLSEEVLPTIEELKSNFLFYIEGSWQTQEFVVTDVNNGEISLKLADEKFTIGNGKFYAKYSYLIDGVLKSTEPVLICENFFDVYEQKIFNLDYKYEVDENDNAFKKVAGEDGDVEFYVQISISSSISQIYVVDKSDSENNQQIADLTALKDLLKPVMTDQHGLSIDIVNIGWQYATSNANVINIYGKDFDFKAVQNASVMLYITSENGYEGTINLENIEFIVTSNAVVKVIYSTDYDNQNSSSITLLEDDDLKNFTITKKGTEGESIEFDDGLIKFYLKNESNYIGEGVSDNSNISFTLNQTWLSRNSGMLSELAAVIEFNKNDNGNFEATSPLKQIYFNQYTAGQNIVMYIDVKNETGIVDATLILTITPGLTIDVTASALADPNANTYLMVADQIQNNEGNIAVFSGNEISFNSSYAAFELTNSITWTHMWIYKGTVAIGDWVTIGTWIPEYCTDNTLYTVRLIRVTAENLTVDSVTNNPYILQTTLQFIVNPNVTVNKKEDEDVDSLYLNDHIEIIGSVQVLSYENENSQNMISIDTTDADNPTLGITSNFVSFANSYIEERFYIKSSDSYIYKYVVNEDSTVTRQALFFTIRIKYDFDFSKIFNLGDDIAVISYNGYDYLMLLADGNDYTYENGTDHTLFKTNVIGTNVTSVVINAINGIYNSYLAGTTINGMYDIKGVSECYLELIMTEGIHILVPYTFRSNVSTLSSEFVKYTDADISELDYMDILGLNGVDIMREKGIFETVTGGQSMSIVGSGIAFGFNLALGTMKIESISLIDNFVDIISNDVYDNLSEFASVNGDVLTLNHNAGDYDIEIILSYSYGIQTILYRIIVTKESYMVSDVCYPIAEDCEYIVDGSEDGSIDFFETFDYSNSKYDADNNKQRIAVLSLGENVDTSIVISLQSAFINTTNWGFITSEQENETIYTIANYIQVIIDQSGKLSYELYNTTSNIKLVFVARYFIGDYYILGVDKYYTIVFNERSYSLELSSTDASVNGTIVTYTVSSETSVTVNLIRDNGGVSQNENSVLTLRVSDEENKLSVNGNVVTIESGSLAEDKVIYVYAYSDYGIVGIITFNLQSTYHVKVDSAYGTLNNLVLNNSDNISEIIKIYDINEVMQENLTFNLSTENDDSVIFSIESNLITYNFALAFDKTLNNVKFSVYNGTTPIYNFTILNLTLSANIKVTQTDANVSSDSNNAPVYSYTSKDVYAGDTIEINISDMFGFELNGLMVINQTDSYISEFKYENSKLSIITTPTLASQLMVTNTFKFEYESQVFYVKIAYVLIPNVEEILVSYPNVSGENLSYEYVEDETTVTFSDKAYFSENSRVMIDLYEDATVKESDVNVSISIKESENLLITTIKDDIETEIDTSFLGDLSTEFKLKIAVTNASSENYVTFLISANGKSALYTIIVRENVFSVAYTNELTNLTYNDTALGTSTAVLGEEIYVEDLSSNDPISDRIALLYAGIKVDNASMTTSFDNITSANYSTLNTVYKADYTFTSNDNDKTYFNGSYYFVLKSEVVQNNTEVVQVYARTTIDLYSSYEIVSERRTQTTYLSTLLLENENLSVSYSVTSNQNIYIADNTTTKNINIMGYGASNTGTNVTITLIYNANGWMQEFALSLLVLPDYSVTINGDVVASSNLQSPTATNGSTSPYTVTISSSETSKTISLTDLITIKHENGDDLVSLDSFTKNITNIDTGSSIDSDAFASVSGYTVTLIKSTLGSHNYLAKFEDTYGYVIEFYFTLSCNNDPTIDSSSAGSLTEGNSFTIGAVFIDNTTTGDGETKSETIIPVVPNGIDGIININGIDGVYTETGLSGTLNNTKIKSVSLLYEGQEISTIYNSGNAVIYTNSTYTTFTIPYIDGKYFGINNQTTITLKITLVYNNEEVILNYDITLYKANPYIVSGTSVKDGQNITISSVIATGNIYDDTLKIRVAPQSTATLTYNDVTKTYRNTNSYEYEFYESISQLVGNSQWTNVTLKIENGTMYYGSNSSSNTLTISSQSAITSDKINISDASMFPSITSTITIRKYYIQKITISGNVFYYTVPVDYAVSPTITKSDVNVSDMYSVSYTSKNSANQYIITFDFWKGVVFNTANVEYKWFRFALNEFDDNTNYGDATIDEFGNIITGSSFVLNTNYISLSIYVRTSGLDENFIQETSLLLGTYNITFIQNSSFTSSTLIDTSWQGVTEQTNQISSYTAYIGEKFDFSNIDFSLSNADRITAHYITTINGVEKDYMGGYTFTSLGAYNLKLYVSYINLQTKNFVKFTINVTFNVVDKSQMQELTMATSNLDELSYGDSILVFIESETGCEVALSDVISEGDYGIYTLLARDDNFNLYNIKLYYYEEKTVYVAANSSYALNNYRLANLATSATYNVIENNMVGDTPIISGSSSMVGINSNTQLLVSLVANGKTTTQIVNFVMVPTIYDVTSKTQVCSCEVSEYYVITIPEDVTLDTNASLGLYYDQGEYYLYK